MNRPHPSDRPTNNKSHDIRERSDSNIQSCPVTLTIKTKTITKGTIQWRFPNYLKGNQEFKEYLKKA